MNAKRIHIGIGATDVERSMAFYRTLFGVEPAKVRDGYVKFEVPEPAVNFTLNRVEAGRGHVGPEHFGIQVDDPATVGAMQARLAAAKIATEVEDDVTCCWARADKVWATDPDGHRWEVFFVHGDADVHSAPPKADASKTPCCEPTCCQ